MGIAGSLVAMYFIALLCPSSLRSYPMLYVAYVRRVKNPTRRENQRLSSIARNARIAVSKAHFSHIIILNVENISR